MNKHNEPIAITGIGCRFPGSGSSPKKFWELLLNKTDAICEVPNDRWDNRRFFHEEDAKPGKIRTKQGGFLTESIKDFDALFFGISPIEGECMDPQERLILEVTYEAIEDAGLTLKELQGSDTGVFIGGFTIDNYLLQVARSNETFIDSNTATGVTQTMLSNKISYTFDFKGPSISIDTACSSSLVALHYACQSIWRGESKIAVVGGANIILLPSNSIMMSKGMFLSPDGRCKTFDSSGNGYGRGEGAGIVILKPLKDAIANNDRIYSLIVGTGVNQDGRTNGVTVPNKESQKTLIEKIYNENNININDLYYIEAHGTGTSVGDPIEFTAINEVLSNNRSHSNKCLIGSVKSNIGHLEGAAGIAGLIKTSLCLYNNVVPANLHFNNPNPAINYEESVLKVPTYLEDLPITQELLAFINSFGYGGTNAHAVLKQYRPKTTNSETVNQPIKNNPFIFAVSAKSKPALRELADDYRVILEKKDFDFSKVLSNVIYRRSHFSNRLAIVAYSILELVEKLEAYKENILLSGVVENTVKNKENKVVFVYTGMGPQWWKMGQELMKKEQVFYDAIKECDKYFTKIAGWSILQEMKLPEDISRIKETRIAQPANLVVQVALTRLLSYYGVTPDAVVGHSVGEVTSAYISGALTLPQAITVSFHRSRLQQTVAGKGKMIALGVGEDKSSKIINGYKKISIAAVNSPNSITLAGDDVEIQSIADSCTKLGIFNKVLEVEVPYHSPLMSPIKEELLAALKNIKGKATDIDLYSTVTGAKLEGNAIDNSYWWRNVRKPVKFAKTVESLTTDGYNVFVEIGPHPVLKNSIIECTNNQNKIQLVQTLNRKKNEVENFFENLALLHTIGFELNWERWIGKLPFQKLPSYPWQKELMWRESSQSLEYRLGREGNIFFNRLLKAPQTTYQVELNQYYFPFLKDHIVQGEVVFPGAGYIAAGIAVSQFELQNQLPFTLEYLEFHQMLVINDSKVQDLYTSYDEKNYFFTISSREEPTNSNWVKRATGRIVCGVQNISSKKLDIDTLINGMGEKLNPKEVYERLSDAKLVYGPYFRTIQSMHIGDNEVMTRIKAHPELQIDLSAKDYYIHPTLLDGCFQSVIGFNTSEFIPISIGRMNCIRPIKEEFYCYVVLKEVVPKAVILDLFICDLDGNIALEIKDFRCQEISFEKIHDTNFLDDKLVRPVWMKEEDNSLEKVVNPEAVYCILTVNSNAVLTAIKNFEGNAIVLELSSSFEKINEHHFKISLENFEVFKQILPLNKKIVIVSMLGLENNTKEDSMADLCVGHIRPLLDLIRYFHHHAQNKFDLNILTQDSQAVLEHDEVSRYDLSVLHGLGRSIVNEIPNCSVRLIDLEEVDSSDDTLNILQLIDERGEPREERFEELALRNNELYLKKLVKWKVEGEVIETKKVPFQDNALKILIDKDNSVEGLKFTPTKREAPKDDEIEILINYTSINYKDYLKITNKINPKILEDTYFEETLGIDCTGIVTRIGKDVSRFKVGDEVIAMAAGTFQTYTTTSELLAVKKPGNLTSAQACSILTQVTAYYGLKHKANLKKGDKVF